MPRRFSDREWREALWGRPKLYIPVGMPGCGKSTLYQTMAHPNLHYVSTDAIREAMGDVNDQSHNDEVFKQYHNSIANSLKAGHDVYADATNLQPFARQRLRDIAANNNAETHLMLFTSLGQAVQRNQNRDRVVPEDVMRRMGQQYLDALRDVPNEPYTSITHI
jgi:predicted kinase